jgi:hypothetical protein
MSVRIPAVRPDRALAVRTTVVRLARRVALAGARRLSLIGALALAFALAAPARAADYTDIWYTPTESGWGVNVVQSDTFLFLTFFIYGPDNKPTWYTAQLTLAGNVYTGPLFLTQGTNWALPWSPADHPAAQAVGTATFTPDSLNAYNAMLTWSVNGVGTATKAITRQTLTTIGLGGSYTGGQVGAYTGCTDSSQNGGYTDTFALTVAQNTAGAATFTFAYGSNATCTLSGTLEQHGQLYRMPGASYACTGSLTYTTTATVYEIKATAQGIEGRFAATLPSSGCQENANFSAVFVQ